MSPSSDSPVDPAEIQSNLDNRIFYHGTNKRLILEQTIQLARHHCAKYESGGWGSVKSERHERLMFDLRNLLVRYGIHGWGEPTDLGGIVIFATDRLKVSEITLSLPTRKLRDEAFDPSTCYSRFDSLDALVAATRTARNPGASNTLAWLNASNATLREKPSP